MKKNTIVGIIGVALFCMVVANLHAGTTINTTKHDAFLSMCSELPIVTDQDRGNSHLSCLSTVSAFNTGYSLSAEHSKQNGFTGKHLWCVSSKVNDGDLLKSVLNWVVLHPKKVDNIKEQFSVDGRAGRSAAYAIITNALYDNYQCK